MNETVPYAPLNIADILRHASEVHGDREVVSYDDNGQIQRTHYRALAGRVAQLAHALVTLGAKPGDCVSTLAWNDLRHLEIYFAVPSLGMICHTVNPRLFGDQIEFILKDANSKWLFIDPQFIPLLLPYVARLTALKGLIVLGESADQIKQWQTLLGPLPCYSYEALLQPQPQQYLWPVLEENLPSGCCYTSGTTGNPKGVYYSQRSTWLHSLALAQPNAANISSADSALVVVPMFHVNGWGLPYAAAMAGAKLVLPGRFMGDGEKLHHLMLEAQVTLAAGVPTVWQAWLTYLQESVEKPKKLKNLRVVIGGAACTERLRAELEAQGCSVTLAWGMTETSPVGCLNQSQSVGRRRLSPGQPVFGVQLRLVDETGQRLTTTGAVGELQVRGPWIARGYLHVRSADHFSADGWFSTGDMAELDEQQFLHITDRAKDVIKSGGEWISSQILENVASSHPAVTAAAVVAIPHPVWDERPLLLVVSDVNSHVTEDEVLCWFDGKVAKWWRPDAVKFIAKMPMTATGKINKKELREQYVK